VIWNSCAESICQFPCCACLNKLMCEWGCDTCLSVKLSVKALIAGNDVWTAV
jgi:hypothetical protein